MRFFLPLIVVLTLANLVDAGCGRSAGVVQQIRERRVSTAATCSARPAADTVATQTPASSKACAKGKCSIR